MLAAVGSTWNSISCQDEPAAAFASNAATTQPAGIATTAERVITATLRSLLPTRRHANVSITYILATFGHIRAFRVLPIITAYETSQLCATSRKIRFCSYYASLRRRNSNTTTIELFAPAVLY